jgi:uncharacterized membrane protein
MSSSSRTSAIIAYAVPVLGWLYVYLVQRDDQFAMFHLKQAIGLVIFLVVAFVAWIVFGFLIAQIPYMAVASISLFPLVMGSYIFGIYAWVKGIRNVMRSEMNLLPAIGARSNRLPIA